MEKNIYIKIHEFGSKNLMGFNYEKIKNELNPLKDWEIEIIKENVENAFNNKSRGTWKPGYSTQPTIFYCIKTAGNEGLGENNKYILSNDSYFNYVDYLELKEAKKMANDARIAANKAQKLSLWALIIAIASITISIIIAIVNTQNVRIDSSQYDEIKNLIIKKQ